MTAGVASAASAQGATAAAGRGGLSGRARAQWLRGNVLAGMGGRRVSFVSGLIGNLVPLPVPDWSKPVILALLLMCVLLAARSWRSARHAGRLESQQTELAADLESMQAALVPEIPTRLDTLEVSVAYRPADGPAAGGDFYDAFSLHAGRVAVIVGDVSGHGRSALARAAHMHYTLRAYVEAGLDPRASLKLAGRVLGADADGLFTTVAIAIYDPTASTLTYASAGHPAPVVLIGDVPESVNCVASPAIGWGLPTGLRQTMLPFPAGARACFFSDGVTEARTDDGLLGRERLAALLAPTGTGVSAPELLERVRNGAHAVTDDMAACVIRATEGVSPRDHRVEELEADAHQLARGQGDRFLQACGVNQEDGARALARAHEIADRFGAALMRVTQSAGVSTVTVDGATSLELDTPALVGAGVQPASA